VSTTQPATPATPTAPAVAASNNWYPNTKPGTTRSSWQMPSHPDYASWQQLAPSINRSVQFGYLVNSGSAGVAVPTLQTAAAPVFPLPTDDWYVIQACGDVDGDGVASKYAATSFTSEIYEEEQGTCLTVN
jgi:hypothetical protein